MELSERAKKFDFPQVGLLHSKHPPPVPKPLGTPFQSLVLQFHRTSLHSLKTCPATKTIPKKLYHRRANRLLFDNLYKLRDNAFANEIF